MWLGLTVVSVAIVAGLASFYSAFEEANEFQDDVLRQIATLYDRPTQPAPGMDQPDSSANRDEESRVFVQVLGAAAASTADSTSSNALLLSVTLPDGLQSVRSGETSYRVFVRTLGDGQRLAVAQDTAARDEIARNSALRTLMPLLALFPILLLVVVYLIRRGFRPVAGLALELDRRGESELHAIAPERVPGEIVPFVGAINRLLGRVEISMEGQRRFVADAAHELRSPLTALSLQAERLANAEMSAEAAERLVTLRQGIERGKSLLNQLLSLARAESAPASPVARLSVQKVYRRALEGLLVLAEDKGIDVGVASDLDAVVLANEADLVTLVRNLVQNAIQYTPAGGRVDLSVATSQHEVMLVIEDNGPGIPESERERVFDPFYRFLGSDEPGSGLGLAIVKAIGARLGARVSLGRPDAPQESGLRVTVALPSIGE
ncbi:MAG: ATP-binding protein [Gammaproteobacteria bacterium]